MGVIRSLFSNSVPACNAKCFLPSCAQNAPNLNNRQKFLLCSKNYLALFVCQGYDFSVKSLQITRACKMKNKTKMDSFDIISFYCNSKKSSASNDQFAQRNWGEFLTTQTKLQMGTLYFVYMIIILTCIPPLSSLPAIPSTSSIISTCFLGSALWPDKVQRVQLQGTMKANIPLYHVYFFFQTDFC